MNRVSAFGHSQARSGSSLTNARTEVAPLVWTDLFKRKVLLDGCFGDFVGPLCGSPLPRVWVVTCCGPAAPGRDRIPPIAGYGAVPSDVLRRFLERFRVQSVDGVRPRLRHFAVQPQIARSRFERCPEPF